MCPKISKVFKVDVYKTVSRSLRSEMKACKNWTSKSIFDPRANRLKFSPIAFHGDFNA